MADLDPTVQYGVSCEQSPVENVPPDLCATTTTTLQSTASTTDASDGTTTVNQTNTDTVMSDLKGDDNGVPGYIIGKLYRMYYPTNQQLLTPYI